MDVRIAALVAGAGLLAACQAASPSEAQTTSIAAAAPAELAVPAAACRDEHDTTCIRQVVDALRTRYPKDFAQFQRWCLTRQTLYMNMQANAAALGFTKYDPTVRFEQNPGEKASCAEAQKYLFAADGAASDIERDGGE